MREKAISIKCTDYIQRYDYLLVLILELVQQRLWCCGEERRRRIFPVSHVDLVEECSNLRLNVVASH